MNRGGFTLVELLIALWGMLLLGVAGYALLRMAGREASAATSFAHASRQQLTAWAVLRHDLGRPWSGDLVAPTQETLEYHRPVGEAPVCGSTASTILLRRSQWIGNRLPDPGRDLLLALTIDTGPHWLSRGIVSVAVANCPDMSVALALEIDAAIPGPAIARVMEPVRLRTYPSGGRHWLGLESRFGLGTIQPILGPIEPDGFRPILMPGLLEVELSISPLLSLRERIPVGGVP